MAIITLTTDFGNGDYMVASVKGEILKQEPDTKIIDISHDVQAFSLGEAAYVIKNVYRDFPDGTIHIIGVDALPNVEKQILAAKIDGHYFICADNGILSLILDELKPEELVEINLSEEEYNTNFPTRDILVRVACHISRGGLLHVIGRKKSLYKHLNLLKPQVKEDKFIIGSVIYIDRFGNVVTNVSSKYFREIRKGRNFIIYVRNFKIDKIFHKYNDIVKDFKHEVESLGNKMVLFNTAGFLEIAIYKSNPLTEGGASSLLGLKKGDNIRIEFFK